MQKILICSSDDKIRETAKETLSNHYPLILVSTFEGISNILENSKDVRLALIDIDQQKNVKKSLETLYSQYTHLRIVLISKDSKKRTTQDFLSKPIKAEALLAIAHSKPSA
jgi:DNA-binding NtrC family response regulator